MEPIKPQPSGNLTQEIIDIMDLKLKEVKEYASLDPSNGWKLDSDKKGLKVHIRKDTGSKWVRGETIVNTTPMDLVERVILAYRRSKIRPYR